MIYNDWFKWYDDDDDDDRPHSLGMWSGKETSCVGNPESESH